MGKQSREKWRRRFVPRSIGEVGESQAIEHRERMSEFKTGLEKTCLFIIRWGIYLALFVPLVVNTQFFFPFVAPKTTLFRVLVEVIFAAYLILVLHKSSYRPKINSITIVITLFLGVFILTSFTGINFARSFWSTYERMTGLFTMFHLYAFYIVLANCFKKREDWEKFLGFSVLAGVFLSIYILNGNQLSTRGGGTIGNTSFMAAYLLFDVFFAVILFFSNFLKKEGWSIFWQIFSGVSLAIMIPVLLTSSARMAVTVFWGGLFLFGLNYLIFSRQKALKRLALGIILVLVILGIILAISQPSFIRDEIGTTIRDMQPRFAVWESGWKGFLEKPILGWGPENFNVVFTKYFNPCMFSSCGGEIWFDRAHNIVLDTLSATGLVGFLSYLSIFGVAIYSLLRTLPKIAEKRNLFLPLGAIVILITYFLQNLLVFDMINTYLVFFLSLAFTAFLTVGESEKEPKVRRVNKFLASAIIIGIIPVFWFGNVKTLLAGHYLVKSIGAQTGEDYNKFFQKSLGTLMNKYEAREQFSNKTTQLLFNQMGSESVELKETFHLTAGEMEKSVKENSLDFRPHLFLGKLYSAYYQFSGEQEYLVLAENILEKAIGISPSNQQGYWYLGEIRLGQRRFEESISLFKKAVELEPKHAQSHWYLALAYRFAGKYQEALEEASQAEKLGYNWKGNLENVKKIADVYNALKDDASLVSLYLEVLKENPNNMEILPFLAASYANLGQYDKAREITQKIKEISPDLAPKVEEFIRTLPQ